MIAGTLLLAGHYYFKYNGAVSISTYNNTLPNTRGQIMILLNLKDWSRAKGWKVYGSRDALYPSDPGFGIVKPMKPSDFNDHGFKKSAI